LREPLTKKGNLWSGGFSPLRPEFFSPIRDLGQHHGGAREYFLLNPGYPAQGSQTKQRWGPKGGDHFGRRVQEEHVYKPERRITTVGDAAAPN